MASCTDQIYKQTNKVSIEFIIENKDLKNVTHVLHWSTTQS